VGDFLYEYDPETASATRKTYLINRVTSLFVEVKAKAKIKGKKSKTERLQL